MDANLTPRQRKAVEALLTNGDVSAAAKTAGVSRDTIHRWMHNERFLAALRDLTQQSLESLSRRLVVLADQAVSTLSQALEDTETPAGVKIRAADIILSRLLQLRELSDLEARVAALEERTKP